MWVRPRTFFPLLTNKKMLTINQKKSNGTYNVTARLDENAYTSMLSLAAAAGYQDVNSFVREAVLTKCENIAKGLTAMYSSRINAYRTATANKYS